MNWIFVSRLVPIIAGLILLLLLIFHPLLVLSLILWVLLICMGLVAAAFMLYMGVGVLWMLIAGMIWLYHWLFVEPWKKEV